MEALAATICGILSDVLFCIMGKREGDETASKRKQDEERKRLKDSLLSLFPTVFKRVLGDNRLSREEIDSLARLVSSIDAEVHGRLSAVLKGEILVIPSGEIGNDFPFVNLFHPAALGEFLIKGRDERNIRNIGDETLSRIVPGLIINLLTEASKSDELSHFIQHVQHILLDERLRRIEEKDILTEETSLSVLRGYLQKEYCNKLAYWTSKLTGGKTGRQDLYRYMAPKIRRVRRRDGEIPMDYEEDAEEFGYRALLRLIGSRERRTRVFLVAGAGVGKTTFLLRLYLDLMKDFEILKGLPVFADVQDMLDGPGSLHEWLSGNLQTEEIGYSKELAARISARLHDKGQLLLLMDSLDQTRNSSKMEKRLSPKRGGGFLGENPALVACRSEDIKGNFETYRRIFNDYEWVLLEKFSRDDLGQYLGEEALGWLGYDRRTSIGLELHSRDNDFEELLRIPFYAHVCKRVFLRSGGKKAQITNRNELLDEFAEELFEDAHLRAEDEAFSNREEESIREFLYLLSLDTLSAEPAPFRQIFPHRFLERYGTERKGAIDALFDKKRYSTQWLYFDKVFEAPGERGYTFRHQLLQEYFAACELKRRYPNRASFNEGLKALHYSPVILDLLDEMLPEHEAVFNRSMEEIGNALVEADTRRENITDQGHFYTWVLALRDRKGKKGGLRDRLQTFFDEELERTREEADINGKFVRIAEGAFLMGSYEYETEQPVRVVYLPEYWISMFAETFEEYDAFCEKYEVKKPPDAGWGRGRRPVINVSWTEARDYCKKALGEDYDLPTEAQWAKAARGRYGRRYPWGNRDPVETDSRFGKEYGEGTAAVDAYGPHLYGIYQMAGNVWEWCLTKWRNDYGECGEKVDNSPEDGEPRVVRGGSFDVNPHDVRCAYRRGSNPDLRLNLIGFRVVAPGFRTLVLSVV